MKSEIVTVETCNCDYVTDDIIWERSYVQNIVVLFGDMVPERRHIENIRQCRAWNAGSKILAIVNDDVADITLNKIWAFTKALNVTTMVYTTSSVKYYTLYPYENFKIVELDKTGLFPPKPLNNLNGSVISVATAVSEPYVLKPQKFNEYTKGLEIRIINTMAKKFNFLIKYILPPSGENPWLTWSDDKVIGNFGLLRRCEADISFYGIQLRDDLCSLADATTVHTVDIVVWVVPTRPFSYNWRSIINLFTYELWGLILGVLVLISITLYLITKYELGSPETSYNFFDAFFQTFGIHLSAPIYFYRKRQLYRLFIFTFSYYTMIIIALYQSSLITHLTTPGLENQYQTVEEAMDDNLIGYFFSPAKSVLNITDHDLWNKILQPGKHAYNINGLAIILDVGINKTSYTLLSRYYVNFITQRNLLDENHEPMVRTLDSPDKIYLVSMFMSKGHPMKDGIDDGILRLSEAGILSQWMKEIAAENKEIQKREESDEDDGPKALTVEHLKGAFYMIALMLSVSMVVFVIEVIYYYSRLR